MRTADLTIEPPTYGRLRMTIPVREALERAGNSIASDNPVGSPDDPCYAYRVQCTGTMPGGIVECLIGQGASQHRGLRLRDETEYPGEMRGAVTWYEHGRWTPCPRKRCARPLVWYEAGYVPGYRVCTRGHHARLSDDGRSASPRRCSRG